MAQSEGSIPFTAPHPPVEHEALPNGSGRGFDSLHPLSPAFVVQILPVRGLYGPIVSQMDVRQPEGCRRRGCHLPCEAGEASRGGLYLGT